MTVHNQLATAWHKVRTMHRFSELIVCLVTLGKPPPAPLRVFSRRLCRYRLTRAPLSFSCGGCSAARDSFHRRGGRGAALLGGVKDRRPVPLGNMVQGKDL